MRLSDGKVHTVDAGMSSLVLHYGNAFEQDGKIMVEVASFEDPSVNPFSNFNYDMLVEENLVIKPNGSRFKRFTIDPEHGSIESENYVEMPNGSIDVPQVNPAYWGRADSKYTYLVKFFASDAVDSNYSQPLVKYDTNLKK